MLLYENAFPSKYEEIKTWYPVWYREVLEMDVLWQVFGGQLDAIQEGIIKAVDNNFIDYADSQAISVIEKWLGIEYDSPRTLDERRNVIKALIVGFGKIGQKEIRDIIAVFTNIPVRVEFAKGVVTIIVPHDAVIDFNFDDVRFVLAKRVPAHLEVTLSRFNTHRYLSNFTHRQLSRYTHRQLRNDPISVPPEPPEPPKPPIIGIPPPTLSLESGEFFLSITVDVIRPENFPDMTVFYFLNGNYSQPFVFAGTPFTVTHTTTVALFGMVGTQMTGLVSYDFVIKQPHFIDTMEFSDSVMTVNADSVAFSFKNVMKVGLSDEFTVGDDVGLTDAINLSFI